MMATFELPSEEISFPRQEEQDDELTNILLRLKTELFEATECIDFLQIQLQYALESLKEKDNRISNLERRLEYQEETSSSLSSSDSEDSGNQSSYYDDESSSDCSPSLEKMVISYQNSISATYSLGSSMNSSCASDLGLVELFDHDNNNDLLLDGEIIFDCDRSFPHDESSPIITKVVLKTSRGDIQCHNNDGGDATSFMKDEDRNNILTQRRALFPFKSIKFLGLLMAITCSLQYYFVVSLDSDICSCRDMPMSRIVSVTNCKEEAL